MTKVFFATIFTYTFLFSLNANAQDYRGATWGMTQRQIQDLEASKQPLVRTIPEVCLTFEFVEDAKGLPSKVFYIFVGDKLVSGVTLSRQLNRQYISRIQTELTEKYGQAIPEVYTNMPSPMMRWKTTTTEIAFAVGEIDSEAVAIIMYDSIALTDLRMKAGRCEVEKYFHGKLK